MAASRRRSRHGPRSQTSATRRRRIGAAGSSRRTGAWSRSNSFAEYAPEPDPETKKKDVDWFALNDDRPLFAFAGIWTTFNGDRGTKSKPAFLNHSLNTACNRAGGGHHDLTDTGVEP
jgi:hypothetical protein